MFDSGSVLKALSSSEPIALGNLPNEGRKYALVDHRKSIRYIRPRQAMSVSKTGYTVDTSRGLRAEPAKFAQAYNTGRMWHSRAPIPKQDPQDAQIAKHLRTIFCRRRCGAVYFAIPARGSRSEYFAALTELEADVQSIARCVQTVDPRRRTISGSCNHLQ